MTHNRATLVDLLTRSGLTPRRELGQNFVVDPNTVRRIAALARVGPNDRVVEIGAGLGSLTLALADTGAEVVAVEVDRGVAAVLRDVVAPYDRVTVLEGDAMTRAWVPTLEARAVSGWTLVANLPYNVATPLVADVLDHVPAVARLLVMVQREVAERFVAVPRTAAYGAISVKIQYWGRPRIVGYVPATVFVPRPNVESALIEIERHQALPAVDTESLFILVRMGFSQRRKMLRGVLRGIVDTRAFAAAGVAPTARAEELDVAAWIALDHARHATGIDLAAPDSV